MCGACFIVTHKIKNMNLTFVTFYDYRTRTYTVSDTADDNRNNLRLPRGGDNNIMYLGYSCQVCVR